MLSRLANIFKIADLRKKVLFTLFIVGMYQLGANIPVPGVDIHQLQALKTQAQQNGILAYLSLFTGGAITRMAVFGLGIMPYITSSIIIQMLTTAIPKLEQWRDEGPIGQKKLTQTTRYLTVALALMQASGLTYAFHSGGLTNGTDLIRDWNFPRAAYIVLTLTAGTAFVMWLGELITEHGIGNGMSILIFANVVSTLPGVGALVLSQGGGIKFSVIVALTIAMLIAIVFIEQGQRRILVVYAKRMQGRKMYGGQSNYIPLKVNQAGVIPVIFASSILYIPVLLSNVIPWKSMRTFISQNLQSTSMYYISIYGGFVILFAYFFVRVVFDPYQQSEMIRKQGGYIPGYRPGPPTERFLTRILNRITLPGSFYLAIFAILPAIPLIYWHIN
ncbi:MAG: preprotein translocase subunit SecY, partial [Acidimicrobiales bacterium]|nr:preprotein translocase subunit SecY [Acidimicrobiales bacterium]